MGSDWGGALAEHMRRIAALRPGRDAARLGPRDADAAEGRGAACRAGGGGRGGAARARERSAARRLAGGGGRAGRRPAAVNVAEAARVHARATRVPARLAAELARAAVEGQTAWAAARAASDFAGFAPTLARIVALKREEAACLAGGRRPATTRCSTTSSPGRPRPSWRRLFDRLRPGLVGLRARIAGSARRPAPALDGQLPAATRSSRSRGGSPTSSATTGRRGGSTSPCIRPRPAPAATCGSPPASTRPTRASACTRRSTRSGTRSTSRGSTRRWRSCRPAPTPRWGCTRASRGCSRTTSAAAAPSAAGWPGDARGLRRAAASTGRGGSTGGQRRRDRLHPHRRRRGALQPARHAALRPRAGADRGRPRGRATSRRPGTTRFLADFGRAVPDARRGVLQDVHWSVGGLRLLPDLHARQRSTPPSSTRRCAATSTSTPGSRRATSGRRSAGSTRASTATGGCCRRGALIAEAIGREPDERALVGYLEAKFGALYGL